MSREHEKKQAVRYRYRRTPRASFARAFLLVFLSARLSCLVHLAESNGLTVDLDRFFLFRGFAPMPLASGISRVPRCPSCLTFSQFFT
jgi:hypothetical protein